MSDIVLGIDLGTTNSVVAVADGSQVTVLSDEAGSRLIPSVVSFLADGQVLVGDIARSRRLIDAPHTVCSIKRLIGRPFRSPEIYQAQQRFAFQLNESSTGGVCVSVHNSSYNLPEISAFVLGEIKRVAERALGQSVRRAVITVPAAFNELQRSATKAAGRIADLDVIRILNEPTAAALAYGIGKNKRERVAVYDLGGGTFDLTLLELDKDVFEVLATAGDSFLGGDDLDLIVAEMMTEHFFSTHHIDLNEDRQAFERIRAAGEWAKCQLTSNESVELTIENITISPRGEPIHLHYQCTRADLEKRAMPLLARSFDICTQALRDASLKVSEIDNIIFVGGATRIPLVRSMAETFFGKPAQIHIDPDLVVAQGAAIHGFTIGNTQNRTALKKITLRKVAVRKPIIEEVRIEKEKRASALAESPKQPAFAPTNQIDGIEDLAPTPRAKPRQKSDKPRDSVNSVVFDLDGAFEDRKDKLPASLFDDDMLNDEPEIELSSEIPLDSILDENEDETLFEEESVLLSDHAPQPTLIMELEAAPILMDVIPLSLGIETVNGYCQHLIRRNSPIPCEKKRIFTTGADHQTSVLLRICQGESRAMDQNQHLGSIELSGLRPAPRGHVKIEVTFQIDVNGILDIHALDLDTGVTQHAQINLLGGISDSEVAQMQLRHQNALHTLK